ncbi:nitrite reductase small subunit NirD [Cellulosimicrobium protaetiae]|uniref:Nitrite reductase small subunit NirD n=1 Tax=Cellulosimicrobium protaetiae TaxID=2587808 RepID=A0A6M5UCP3_9MICO|nr:nitrite reductase small subunit NirD [Cellulosimicrobium protaetiae]QJW34858.1 nitrite reductase small subunit NirD [Cellulosimicrobium protaetiae]
MSVASAEQAGPVTMETTEWERVCLLRDLLVERGAAALVGGVQVALFRLPDDTVRVVQQRDPYSGANVMSRGIVGTRGGVPTVAGPMYKQVFDLATGRCLEAAGYVPVQGLAPDLATWPAEVRDGVVHVGDRPVARPDATADGAP